MSGSIDSLSDIIQRTPVPVPWDEGDNIPWNEPGFSDRMLREHLSQAHDAASRRSEGIDAHVDWIQTAVLEAEPSRILDLGCGPGFYATRFAKRGHQCTGIDFSPASIAYAKDQAAASGLSQTFIEGDIRTTDYGEGFDLVMLIFGELNVFAPHDAEEILKKAYAALRPGGRILLEPNTAEAVEYRGRQGRSWYSSTAGLFSSRPHLVFEEHAWDSELRASTTRYFIVDAETRAVTRHAGSAQAYSEDELRALLGRIGFNTIERHASLTGEVEQAAPGSVLSAWVARQ